MHSAGLGFSDVLNTYWSAPGEALGLVNFTKKSQIVGHLYCAKCPSKSQSFVPGGSQFNPIDVPVPTFEAVMVGKLLHQFQIVVPFNGVCAIGVEKVMSRAVEGKTMEIYLQYPGETSIIQLITLTAYICFETRTS